MRNVFYGAIFILVLNLLLNLWVVKFNSKVPLSGLYWGDGHYYEDQRVSGGKFDLIRGWGQTDSQWYLKIAAAGYGEPKNLDIWSRKLDGLSYAFFPLYPLLIKATAFFTGSNFELAAFILGNLIMLVVCLSLIYVLGNLYSKKLALFVTASVFLFPFSLFLRSYHAEGLYLLELTWWLFYLSEKKYGKAAIFLALLNITKGTGWFLNLLFFLILLKEKRVGKMKIGVVCRNVFTALLPIFMWLGYVYKATGDPLYFLKAMQKWSVPELPAVVFNIFKLFNVFHEIKTGNWINVAQVFIFLVMCYLIYRGKKLLKPEWWWTSVILLLVPTLTTYSAGHTSGRLAVIQLPLWVCLSLILSKRWKITIIIVFTVLLFAGSLYFVNWYWWG